MSSAVNLLVGAAAAAVLLSAAALCSLRLLPERAKRELLCERLNHHRGKPEVQGEYVYFRCSRCGGLHHPRRRQLDAVLQRSEISEE